MSDPVRLIIGLGNPGPDYQLTRHNAGFWLADQIADQLNVRFTLEKNFSAWVAKGRFENENVIIAKPTTYMNRSGLAAGALTHFYKFEPRQILVLHDELDLMPGQVKIKFGGGHAGHNGLRDIHQMLGSADYWRLRLGIGHPRTLGLAQQVAAFVLNAPRKQELDDINRALERCYHVLPSILRGDMEAVARELHGNNHA